ncbi:delta-sarcoglycan-like [Plodia interpunctella]|uniref:delta-sarcoglycan-like n=1 Tax=Plodia interpunctella TaxID=58824 RepID=UPI002368791C|nr:delta-sarcoglycan-like [Plodia interpunctella]XP_053600242.1 delta-sarcoglycan-like [Plodia interpunctella]XP_053600243.1 delta-sarcoglycan-like [Plodia interpunctella]
MSVEDTSASTGIIRGWGCTPTGDPPPTTDAHAPVSSCVPAALIRGWRRTALYAIIVFLMILVFLNIALTLWIIGTLKLSTKGIGPIKIINNGIQFEGQAWIVDKLVASTISSQTSQPLNLHSHRNFTVLVSDPKRMEFAKLVIRRDSVECNGRNFDVRDGRGDSIFFASKDEVRVFADALTMDGEGGVSVPSAVQTPMVRAPFGSDLQLESLTRQLYLKAPQLIKFDSRAGSIDVTSHSDVKLSSVVGAIKIDAANIVINNLKIGSIIQKEDKQQKAMWANKVYQLCACDSGKLFLAAPDAACESPDEELCR